MPEAVRRIVNEKRRIVLQHVVVPSAGAFLHELFAVHRLVLSVPVPEYRGETADNRIGTLIPVPEFQAAREAEGFGGAPTGIRELDMFEG